MMTSRELGILMIAAMILAFIMTVVMPRCESDPRGREITTSCEKAGGMILPFYDRNYLTTGFYCSPREPR
jgi:hypothetical protein